MSITELAIKRPSLIVVIFAILGFLGYVSYTQLSYELLPKFSSPVVTVSTVYPGASPSEVENSVTKKVEDAISAMENIVSVRSTSQEGFSFVMVELTQSANVDISLQDAQRKVNAIVSNLPGQSKTPVLTKFAIDELPIMRIGVSSNLPPTEFYQVVKKQVQPALSKIPGVAQINLIGGEEREVRVNVDENRLKAYKLSLLQITQAINNANLDFPTGRVKNSDEQVTVRLAGKFSSLDDLKNLVVANTASGAVKLQDIAEVTDSKKDVKNINRITGRTSIGMLIQKQSDANAVEVSKLVRKELANLEKAYQADNMKFDIAQDSSIFTMDAADAVIHDLMMAILLVALVMLVFLHSLRNSFIVMLAIPASLISTFIAMYIFNFTLNLMTLLALSLVVGILVDDSIVVLENIYRHLEMGKDRIKASIEGRKEIAFTAISITLVDVVVFLPLSLVDGLIANILRQFSLVVVVSTLLSLFVSFTVTPLLASRLSKVEHLNANSFFGRLGLWFEKQIENFTNSYAGVLTWSLRHKFIVLTSAFLMLAGSIMLVAFGFIGSEFVASGDRGEFVVQLEMDKSTTIENNNRTTQKVENLLLAMPEVKKVFANVGGSSGLIGSQSSENNSELTVILIPQDQRLTSTAQFAKQVRTDIEKIPGLKVRTAEIAIFGGTDQAPIQIIVSSPDKNTIMPVAKQVLEIVKKVPGTIDEKLTVEEGNPEINISVDKEKMANLGLSLSNVGATMQTAFSGNDDAKFRDNDDEYDIRVMLDAFDRTNVNDISNLTFVNNRGELIKLNQFANITRTVGTSKLERKDRVSSITVQSQVVGRPSGTVGQEIQQIITNTKLPADVKIAYDGDLKNQNDAFGSLGIALIASILFVYLIMVALYDSYIYPFVVLFSIPVAIVGALLALALTMSTLSIFTMLGIIMLVGLVAKNAILLVDFTNQLKAEGKPVFEALVEAGKVRLRPILMTTIAMVIGFLPIALANGAGAEWKNGLAWALIGGLTSSMLLTLVVVPVVYLIVDKLKARVSIFFKRGNKKQLSNA
jgi:hydrophobe/amphiphile efflux-1 (HAE1) family protein